MAENRELALILKLVADQFQSELKKSGGLVGDFMKIAADWRVQLTAIGTTLLAIAKSTANYGDELVKMSQRLGTSIEDTARLQHAARLADTDLQGLSSTVGMLSREMVLAANGNAEAQGKFDLLGIAVRNANGQLKSTTDILLEVSDKFRRMPDGPEKTGQAMLVLGKNAKEVLPFLNSDLRDAFTEADKLGLVMNEKAAKAAEHFNDELTKLQGAIRGLTNDVGTVAIPVFDAMAHGLRTIVEDAHAVLSALLNLQKIQAEGPQVLKPEGGGRNLLIMPVPPKAEQDQFVTEPSGFVQRSQQNIGEAMRERFVMEQRILASLRQQEEERGRAKVALLLEANRATDIGFDLQAKRLRERLDMEEAAAQQEARVQAWRMRGQEALGKAQREYAVAVDASSKKELDARAQNLQAWVTYAEQVGGSNELMLEKRLDLVRVELAKELSTTEDTAARLLIAWQRHDYDVQDSIRSRLAASDRDVETALVRAETKYRTAIDTLAGDFWDGWARGMRKYAVDQSMFGLAADMARRLTQTTEQGVQKFLLDAAEGRLQRLKDVASSILNIVTQMVVQMGAQLLTKQIIGGLSAGFPSVFSTGPKPAITGDSGGFAAGGSFLVGGSGGVDSQLVAFRASPNERVTVETPDQQRRGGLVVQVVNNNYSRSEVQSSAQQTADGKLVIVNTIRDVVRGMVDRGELDKSMRFQYGLRPQASGGR